MRRPLISGVGWLALAALLAAGAALAWRAMRPAGDPRDAARTAARREIIRLAAGTTLAVGRGPSIALSPDGRRLAYVGASGGTTQLYLRDLDRGDAVPIAGTNGAGDPFFSPDGRSLGFIADQKLKKISIDGGAAVMLAEVPAARGVAWPDDDRIVLVPRDNTGLWRVSAQGGKLEPLTTLADGDTSHRWPQILPGGKAVLYTIWGGEWDLARLAVQPLAGGDRTVIVTGGGFGRFVGDDKAGYLLYAEADSLVAVPFDLSRLQIAGQPIVVADVIKNFSGGVQAAISSSGSLAYLPQGAGQTERELVWVDRQAAASPAATVSGLARRFDLSSDGSRIARYKVEAETGDVWIDELSTGKATRVSFHADPMPASRVPNDRLNPVWSADGRHVAYASGTPATNLYLADVDNGGQPERLTTSRNAQWPTSWSRDARTLAYVEADPLSGSDIWLLTLDAARKPASVRPFLRTPFTESVPAISPDGRWVAYHSNESGRVEVYVQPWPEGGRRWQVSTDGGAWPRWSPRGDELFFRSGPARTAMASVAVKADPEFTPAPPRGVFDLRGYDSPFCVSPDAQRFLLLRLPGVATVTQVTVVANWLDELRHPR